MKSLTILITGGTAGFGLLLTKHALNKGHKVIATARSVSKAQQTNPEIEKQGGIWLELDVTKSNIRSIISEAVSKYEIDVVINNAGYVHRGVIEHLEPEDVQAQFQTNLFGPIQVVQGALPHFRARKQGTIVNISSIVSLYPSAGAGIYASSKAALDSFTEALEVEVKPFGIRVLNITPGAFRTRFLAAESAISSGFSEAYKDTPGARTIQGLAQYHGNQPGDPQKGIERMLEFITAEGLAGKVTESRLFIGSDSMDAVKTAVETLDRQGKASREVAMSCNVD